MKNIAIFASGGGSNFKAIYKQIKLGFIDGNIVLFVTNNKNCNAYKFAKEKLLTTFVINKFRYPNLEIGNNMLIRELFKHNVDLICLAGYMKMVPLAIIKKFKNCILNIHPSLLPNFGGKGYYGERVHKAVIASREKISGATVHFVDENYDTGPIVLQKTVVIGENDSYNTLADKVLAIEHQIYSIVIKAYCENKIIWKNNKPNIEVEIEN